jgi:predicted MPP superfamily phosphohydrolase
VGRGILPGLLAALAVALLFYAVAVEPFAVGRHDVRVRVAGLPSAFEGYRILHLSDLEATSPGLREERVARIAREARPDLVVVTGDLTRKNLTGGRRWRAIREMAVWLAALQPPDGVWFVQGHGEMASHIDEGTLKSELAAAGIGSLWDEVHLISRGDDSIALAGVKVHDYGGEGPWEFPGPGLIRQGPGSRPTYLELEAPGASTWTDYDIAGRLRFSSPEDWVGVMAHSRLSTKEDRFYLALRRSTRPYLGISAHGTTYSRGRIERWRPMEAGQWHRFRLRVETRPAAVNLRARVWPDGDDEPAAWDLEYADAAASRIASGAPGLYAEGPGIKEFADLNVVRAGDMDPVSGDTELKWREPAGSDLLLDLLARVPAGAPVILLSHTPDIFPEARELDIPLTLAGHTQGGQIRLPLIGALVTDTRLGRGYAAGLFVEGRSALFTNRGVGTTRIPLRFLSPPEAAVVTLAGGDAP